MHMEFLDISGADKETFAFAKSGSPSPMKIASGLGTLTSLCLAFFPTFYLDADCGILTTLPSM